MTGNKSLTEKKKAAQSRRRNLAAVAGVAALLAYWGVSRHAPAHNPIYNVLLFAGVAGIVWWTITTVSSRKTNAEPKHTAPEQGM